MSITDQFYEPIPYLDQLMSTVTSLIVKINRNKLYIS